MTQGMLKIISMFNKDLKNNYLHRMKVLHSIPIDKFIIIQQQEYYNLLRFITVIRQKLNVNYDMFIEEKLSGHLSTNKLKT